MISYSETERFNKFFYSLGEKYWDLVSDAKIAEQFLVAEKHRPVPPKFFRYCDNRISILRAKDIAFPQ